MSKPSKNLFKIYIYDFSLIWFYVISKISWYFPERHENSSYNSDRRHKTTVNRLM